jgi:hypothetical protein
MRSTLISRGLVMAAAIFSSAALAKLPPPSEEAKAKAAEAAAKTEWSNKVAAYQLCKSMDKVAAEYFAESKQAGKDVKPAAATPPCADPGPFVAEAKPLEAAGAHSPAATAATPPNAASPAAAASQPAKKP